MKKLIILFIGIILSTVTFASVIECKDKLDLVLSYRHDKLDNPNYIQIVKNKMEDEDIPIVIGGTEIYSTDSNFNAFGNLVSKSTLGKLFKSDTIKVEYNSNYYILYPIKDIKRRYIAGILILGYSTDKHSEDLGIHLELVETYLSQVLNICD